jgi:hypothetical protein
LCFGVRLFSRTWLDNAGKYPHNSPHTPADLVRGATGRMGRWLQNALGKSETIDGKNPRRVTLAEFRAEIEARKAAAAPIMDALRRNDITGCAAAQATFRKQFA